ncbi:hypothetical protein G6F40_016974 [Rhizopus arrhizus]|nr:hypothetical protein G6F40_016974 [Rhizopus arrhizus]
MNMDTDIEYPSAADDSDTTINPIIYEHTTQESQLSIIQQFAVAFYKIADESSVSREAERQLGRCINTFLIQKLNQSTVDGTYHNGFVYTY